MNARRLCIRRRSAYIPIDVVQHARKVFSRRGQRSGKHRRCAVASVKTGNGAESLVVCIHKIVSCAAVDVQVDEAGQQPVNGAIQPFSRTQIFCLAQVFQVFQATENLLNGAGSHGRNRAVADPKYGVIQYAARGDKFNMLYDESFRSMRVSRRRCIQQHDQVRVRLQQGSGAIGASPVPAAPAGRYPLYPLPSRRATLFSHLISCRRPW